MAKKITIIIEDDAEDYVFPKTLPNWEPYHDPWKPAPVAPFDKKNWEEIMRGAKGLRPAQPYQPCLIEAFFKAHPDAKSCPIMISCSCPRCRVYCY